MIHYTLDIEIGRADPRLQEVIDALNVVHTLLIDREIGYTLVERREPVFPGDLE